MGDDIIVKFIVPDDWKKDAFWELQKDYTIQGVTVPKGYVSNGASIPWYLRSIFSPTGRYFGASIMHDYVLGQERDWPKSNDLFEKALIESDIAKWRRIMIVWAVKANYAYLKYKGREHEYYDPE